MELRPKNQPEAGWGQRPAASHSARLKAGTRARSSSNQYARAYLGPGVCEVPPPATRQKSGQETVSRQAVYEAPPITVILGKACYA